jgi:hypothetical protein
MADQIVEEAVITESVKSAARNRKDKAGHSSQQLGKFRSGFLLAHRPKQRNRRDVLVTWAHFALLPLVGRESRPFDQCADAQEVPALHAEGARQVEAGDCAWVQAAWLAQLSVSPHLSYALAHTAWADASTDC